MLELAAAMEIARSATRSAMEEEPSALSRPPERSPRLRPALAAGLRRFAGVIDLPPAGGGDARAPRSSST
ncbi:MAG: hypothetical protein ACRDJT_01300 [Actinomycetota bacterium]